jgi:hypothetical protein
MELLLTPVSENMNAVHLGRLIIVKWGKRRLGLFRRNGKVFVLISPEALGLLKIDLKEVEVFQRVLFTMAKGNYAWIIPPDGKYPLEIYRGRTKEEARGRAWQHSSFRFFSGALFKAVDRKTVERIVRDSSQTG